MTTTDDRNGLMNHKFDQTKYVTDDELKQLIKERATFTRHNLPSPDYEDAAGFSMQLVTSEDKWRTSTNIMSGQRVKQLGEQNIREQLEKRMFQMIRDRQPAANQNADIVKPITKSHEESPGTHALVGFEFAELEMAKLEKQNKKLLEALTNILDMGNTGEDARAMKELAREAINKPTEEI